jgi:hypothetical protein
VVQPHPILGDVGLRAGMPKPLSGIRPPYAKPDAWLPIASPSTTMLRTPDFAR